MSEREVRVLPTGSALAQEAARRFVQIAQLALEAHGRFTVALAGGSTPAGLYRLLADPPFREQIDWRRTLVFFGDERCVPPTHVDSNYQLTHATLLGHVPLPEHNVYRIMGELEAPAAGAAYETTLRTAFALNAGAWPRFDLILLGMGEDGHTASLFPDMPALDEADRLAVATEVPDYVTPNVPRVTLTLPVLDEAANVLFLVSGAAKARAVYAVLSGPELAADLPARRVRPTRGRLVWLLDEAAAGDTTWPV